MSEDTTDTTADDEPFFTVNGREHCDHEAALARLLADEVLSANERATVPVCKGDPGESTIVLYVLCSDTFAWGCADAEPLPLSEVGPLYRMHVADPRHGATRWVCRRRGERPQRPIERRMREAGAWDDEMEGLKLNGYELRIRGLPVPGEGGPTP